MNEKDVDRNDFEKSVLSKVTQILNEITLSMLYKVTWTKILLSEFTIIKKYIFFRFTKKKRSILIQKIPNSDSSKKFPSSIKMSCQT